MLHDFKVKKDPTKKNGYYCVLQNPFNPEHDTKVIFGGSVEIVQRKIIRQYKKFEESAKL